MAKEPTYPKDAKVGEGSEEMNETLREAVTRKEAQSASGQKSGGRSRAWVTGAAVGVGSAAVVAALLYANRSRRADRAADKDEDTSS